MKLIEFLAIVGFIVISLTIVTLFPIPRHQREGFESSSSEKAPPEGTPARSALGPDTYEPTYPAHLLVNQLQFTRPFNQFGTLTQQGCFEQDGNNMYERLGNYAQRTNNYKHTYPDSCSAPFKELVGSFYAPREGAIGAPIPKGAPLPPSTQPCT